MQWLNKIADDLIARHPEGEILIESGGSPSGTHHLGHIREPITADAVMLELRRRGREARHIYFVDDLDALRKIPVDVPADYEKYLGYPLADVPAPGGGEGSYADYFLKGLIDATAVLGIEVEFIRSHSKYREGFFVPAIERSLERVTQAREALEAISGRTLDEHWTPIQVMEDGRLKNRKFISIDEAAKTLQYEDAVGAIQTVNYSKGEVKLDWRLDWPGRWWLLRVQAEPSGRDHMTKGSSYDTGVQIMKDVYEAEPPYPISYDFINMVGDTKKMSASKGTGLDVLEAAQLMPAEVMRYYVLRSEPLKRLYFDLAKQDAEIIKAELQFIDAWLQKRAPEDVKFSLAETVKKDDFTDQQQKFMAGLASKIEQAPEDADGAWFHQAIYDFKDSSGLEPKALFTTLYEAIIAKESGPRAGWFLSLLPRDWLVNRLRLES
jgi:lysyl-tRNA synthetase class 1